MVGRREGNGQPTEQGRARLSRENRPSRTRGGRDSQCLLKLLKGRLCLSDVVERQSLAELVSLVVVLVAYSGRRIERRVKKDARTSAQLVRGVAGLVWLLLSSLRAL